LHVPAPPKFAILYAFLICPSPRASRLGSVLHQNRRSSFVTLPIVMTLGFLPWLCSFVHIGTALKKSDFWTAASWVRGHGLDSIICPSAISPSPLRVLPPPYHAKTQGAAPPTSGDSVHGLPRFLESWDHRVFSCAARVPVICTIQRISYDAGPRSARAVEAYSTVA